jgi:hypothetical protein
MPRMILTIGCALLLAGACSDDDTPPTVDSAADLSAADLSAADHTVQPDVAAKDTTPGADAAGDAVATPDTVDPACNNVQCNLKNDCCDCAAWHNAGPSPAPCTITSCKQPTCGALGLKAPAAYCHGGHCSVRDDGSSCSSDADCQLINDCCWCAAWPKAAKAPACPQRSCLISSCTQHKLGNIKARCVGGVCRLGL